MNWSRYVSQVHWDLVIPGVTVLFAVVLGVLGVMSGYAKIKADQHKSQEQMRRHEQTLKQIWQEANRTNRDDVQVVVTYRMGTADPSVLPTQAELFQMFPASRLTLGINCGSRNDETGDLPVWNPRPLMDKADAILLANQSSAQSFSKNVAGDPFDWTDWSYVLYFSDFTGNIPSSLEFLAGWNGAGLEVFIEHAYSGESSEAAQNWMHRITESRADLWDSGYSYFLRDIVSHYRREDSVATLGKLEAFVDDQTIVHGINGLPWTKHLATGGGVHLGFTGSPSFRQLFQCGSGGAMFYVLPLHVQAEVYVAGRLVAQQDGLIAAGFENFGYEDHFTVAKFPTSAVASNAFPSFGSGG